MQSVGPKVEKYLQTSWALRARPNQFWPDGEWLGWLLRKGRGAGKTRTLAETSHLAVEFGYSNISLCGRTFTDLVRVLVNGPAGIIKTQKPHNPCRFIGSKEDPRVVWRSGAIARLYTADSPDGARGANSDLVLADELAHWRYIDEAWGNLMYGLRIKTANGLEPRWVIGTTPLPIQALKDIEAGKGVVVSTGSSYDNLDNMGENMRGRLESLEGTALATQEIYGDYLGIVPGMMYSSFDRRVHIVDALPDRFDYTIAGLDWGVDHPTALIIVGVRDGIAYVVDELIERKTATGAKADKIKALCAKWKVSRIYIDPSAAQAKIDLRVYGVQNLADAKNDVKAGIQYVRTLFDRRQLVIHSSCDHTLSELLVYRQKTDAHGNVLDCVPVKEIDDACDAVRYVLFSAPDIRLDKGARRFAAEVGTKEGGIANAY